LVGQEDQMIHMQGKQVLMQFKTNSVAVVKAKLVNLASNNNKVNTEVGDQFSRTSRILQKCIGVNYIYTSHHDSQHQFKNLLYSYLCIEFISLLTPTYKIQIQSRHAYHRLKILHYDTKN